ncbi:MAG: nucleoside hydrolase [Spirosomataceae bacterium]
MLNRKTYLVATLLFAWLSAFSQKPTALIFDTDIGPDYDDVGAMALLHAFADKGQVKILATVASNKHPLVGPTIEILNRYFKRPSLPIGEPKTAGVNVGGFQHWADTLVARYPHRLQQTADAQDATALYRKLLAEQPDNSVTIVTVGFLTNIANLLQSKPDHYSPLYGNVLVAKKVKQWVAMAGRFPEGREFNIFMDSTASAYAIDHFPKPIIFSGFEIGAAVKTGLKLVAKGQPNSPVREVFRISIPMADEDKNGRMSWDQTATLAAAQGAEPYFELKKGRFVTIPSGRNGWKDDPKGPHYRLVFKQTPQQVAEAIEALMMHQPK